MTRRGSDVTGVCKSGGSSQRAAQKHLALVFAVLCLLLVTGAASAFAEDAGDASDALPTSQGMTEAVEAGPGQPLAASVTDPTAAEELPHQDLGREEARELLEGVFEVQLDSPAGVFDDLAVTRFLAPNVAVVPIETGAGSESDTPSGGAEAPEGDNGEEQGTIAEAVLLDSTMPLSTESPSGHAEAVDLSLELSDGAIRPANPLAEVEIPRELGEGITLPGPDVVINLAEAPATRASSIIDQSVAFLPNVATDTDLAILPTPTGVETLSHLRSADAPTTQTFDLQLPPGAALKGSGDGGAVVRGDDGEPLVSISTPTAIDAAGASVPVDLEVEGNSIILAAHPDASTQFPVLLDPLYQTYEWMKGNYWQSGICNNSITPETFNPCMEREEWGYEYGTPYTYDRFRLEGQAYSEWFPVPMGTPGIFIKSSGTLTAGERGAISYTVPRFYTDHKKYGARPTSFISSMKLQNLDWNATSSNLSPYLFAGIWDTANAGWISHYNHEGLIGHNLSNMSFPYIFQNAGNSNGKLASVAIHATESKPNGLTELYVGTASIELSDTIAPSIGPVDGPVQWVDQTAAPVSFAASDSGLGVHSLVATSKDAPQASWKTARGCIGVGGSPCPRHWKSTDAGSPALKYDPAVLPHGLAYVDVASEDPVGNKSPLASVQVKVDHIAPTLMLSGTLTEQATLGTSASQYTLKYSAADGDEQAASALAPFGGEGTGPGKTQWPVGIATDPNGNVFVVDRDNHRIEKFDASGKFLMQFGSLGSGPGQFKEPRGIAVSPGGRVWVSETGNKRIQQFTLNGTYVSQIAYPQFVEPFGLATGPGDSVWVSDLSTRRVMRFGFNGALLNETQGTPAAASPAWYFGLASDASGNLWVTDSSNHRLLKYDSTGKYIAQFGTFGSGDGQLKEPTFLTVAPSGNLIVTDSGNNRMQVFGPTGEYLKKYGSFGAGPSQLSYPRGVALGSDGTAYVADSSNHRIARWSHPDQDPQSGVTKVQIKVDGQLKATPYNQACATQSCSTNGEWLLDASKYTGGGHTVEVVATDVVGRTTLKMVEIELHPDRTPPAVALSGSMTEQATLGSSRPRYTLKWTASDVVGPDGAMTFASTFGSFGAENGQFRQAADVAVDAKGNVWAVDRGNNRLQKFNTKGEFIAKFGSAGAGKGQLSSPTALAIDSKGAIWVTDSANNRVVQFSEAGAFLAAIGKDVNKSKVEAAGTEAQRNLCTAASGDVCQAGLAGSANGQFSSPSGIALSAGGNLYVVDRGNDRVQKLSPEGAYLAKFGSPGTAAGQLKEPSGVAVAANGDIWIADAGNNRIQAWTSTFGFIRQVGAQGAGNGQFKAPGSIAIDAGGNLWVADQGNGRIQQFSPSGGYLGRFGTPGSAAGQLNLSYPSGIEVDLSGVIWVADGSNYRIQKWVPAMGSISGAVSTLVKVDGKAVDTYSPGCPAGGCAISREWTLNSNSYSQGQHTVEVTATDGAGFSSSKSLTITIVRDTTPPQITANSTFFTAPEGWVEQKSYGYSASATDANGFGVTSIVLKVDGQTINTATQTCPDGACPKALSGSINTEAYEGGAHPAELVATDGAGNVAKKSWTLNVDPKGVITSGEAEDTLEAVEDTTDANLLGDSKEEADYEGTAPDLGIVEGQAGLETTGTVVPTEIADDSAEGFIANTIEYGALNVCQSDSLSENAPVTQSGTTFTSEAPNTPCPEPPGTGDSSYFGLETIKVSPANTPPSAGDTKLVDGDATIAPNTGNHVDLVSRPLYDGILNYAVIRDVGAPDTYSWEVALRPGQQLKLVDEKNAVVYYANGVAAFTITAEPAYDAIGTTVNTALSVSEDKIVYLLIHHRAGSYVYPVMAGTGWQGGFTTHQIEGPQDQQEIKEEEERIAREQQEALELLWEQGEGGNQAAEEQAEAEVEGPRFRVKIASFGPPVPDAVNLAGQELKPKNVGANRKKFKFTVCYPRIYPDETPTTWPDPKKLPPIGKREQAPRALSECHKPENHGVWWAVSVHGRFHYKYQSWVWIKPEEFQCVPKWGVEQPALVHCKALLFEPGTGPAHAVKGPIHVLGEYRFAPGSGGFPAEAYSTCATIGGELYPNPRSGQGGPVERPLIYDREYVHPIYACSWR